MDEMTPQQSCTAKWDEQLCELSADFFPDRSAGIRRGLGSNNDRKERSESSKIVYSAFYLESASFDI